MNLKKQTLFLITLLCGAASAYAHDTILEFKGAYFLPTNNTFKKIYGPGAMFGPELTIQMWQDAPWYAFGSFDYFKKDGHSLGLCTPTQIKLIPLALGIKYFINYSCDLDFYLGLGFQAIDMRTQNCTPAAIITTSQWGFGGIAKVGAYYYLPHNFVLDFFIDYSFVNVGNIDCKCANIVGIQPSKAHISGGLFGAALGYRF